MAIRKTNYKLLTTDQNDFLNALCFFSNNYEQANNELVSTSVVFTVGEDAARIQYNYNGEQFISDDQLYNEENC